MKHLIAGRNHADMLGVEVRRFHRRWRFGETSDKWRAWARAELV